MDKLDSAIVNSISENFHDLKDFHNIDYKVPSSDMMLKEIYKHVKKGRRKKLSAPAKLAVVCLIIIIVFPAILFLGNTKSVSAYRYKILKLFAKVQNGVVSIQGGKGDELNESKEQILTFTDYEKAKSKIPFVMSFPSYILQGYNMESIDVKNLVDGSAIVEIRYKHDEGNIYMVHADNINNDKQMNDNVKMADGIKKIEINDVEAYYVTNGSYSKVMWMDKGVYYEINGGINIDDALEPAASFQ